MRVLIVEDEPRLRENLRQSLVQEGYAVDCSADGEEGEYMGLSESYDAVILDLGLPKIDGLGVLRAWRRQGRVMPVMILTARDGWTEKVNGLDAGADDYLVKPFRVEELVARLRALIRRSSGQATAELRANDVVLDTRGGHVEKDGQPVHLTSQEYNLLSYMLHHKGKLVSRTELIDHIYDHDADHDSNTIEVFIMRLRKKLGSGLIETVRGLGYRIKADRESA